MADIVARSGPPKEAVNYLNAKGYKTSFNWRDTWGEEHAHAFTVAKAMEHDVLRDIRSQVERAIQDGITLEEFKSTLTPRLQKMGWWGKKKIRDPKTGELVLSQLGSPRRLDVIYWANTRSAYAAGQWERVQRTKNMLPYLVYELGPSEHHRPHHVDIANAPTILPVDHSYWDTHYPPNGFGCECRLGQITKREADGMGGVSAEPKVELRAYENRRTGEVTNIPVGIDAGWHTNPGKARAKTLMQGLQMRISEMGPQAGKQLINQYWKSGSIVSHIKMVERVMVPVAIAKQRVKEFGGIGSLISIPSKTAEKKIEKHGISIGEFSKLQFILDAPEEIVKRPNGSIQYWKRIDGVWHVVALKNSRDGYVRVATYFKSSPRRLAEVKRVEARINDGGK